MSTSLSLTKSPVFNTLTDTTYTIALSLRLCAFSALLMNYYKGYPNEERKVDHWCFYLLPLQLAIGLVDRASRLRHVRENASNYAHDEYNVKKSFILWVFARGCKSYALELNWPRFVFDALDMTVMVAPNTWDGINYGALLPVATLPVIWDFYQLARGTYTEDPAQEHKITTFFRVIRDVNVCLNSAFYFAKFCNYPIMNLGFATGVSLLVTIFSASMLLAAARAIYFSHPKTKLRDSMIDYVRQCLSGFTMYMSITSTANLLNEAFLASYLNTLKIITVSLAFALSVYHNVKLAAIRSAQATDAEIITPETAQSPCHQIADALQCCFFGTPLPRTEDAAVLANSRQLYEGYGTTYIP